MFRFRPVHGAGKVALIHCQTGDSVPNRPMPTISTFYGLVILMFWDDHNPPHFHVRYGGDQAVVRIADLEIIEGDIPRRAQRLLLEWAELHQAELMENWELCRSLKPPKTVAPLP